MLARGVLGKVLALEAGATMRGSILRGAMVAVLTITVGVVGLSGPASAATGAGYTGLSTSDGTTIENGTRGTIWYKAAPGYHDFNQTSQSVCEHYTAYYQNSGSGVWHEASSKSHYLCGGSNSPWEVLLTNVQTGTPMTIGTRTAFDVYVHVAY